MTIDLFLALVVFAFVMSVTPGPNNVMLLASGVNYGFRRSIPHMLGITIGFSFMIVVVGLGLGQVFERFPVTYEILRYGGRRLHAVACLEDCQFRPGGRGQDIGLTPDLSAGRSFPVGEPQGLGHHDQRHCDLYAGNGSLWPVLIVALVCGVVNFPTISIWTMFGTLLRNLLRQATFLRIFNVSMAVLLVLSLAPLVWH